MSYGTKIVTNGNPNESDVRWGIVLKVGAWISVLTSAVLATLICAAVLKVFEMASNLTKIQANLDNIQRQIAVEDYMTRDEFAQWADSEARVDSIRSMASEGANHEQIARELERLRGDRR